MKAELEQKKPQLISLDTDLKKTLKINDHVVQTYPYCVVDLSKFSDKANQLTERWHRIEKEIDDR